MLCWKVYLEIPEFREGVDDDAKDDVEADGGDEDEEGHVVQYHQAKLLERLLVLVWRHHLSRR